MGTGVSVLLPDVRPHHRWLFVKLSLGVQDVAYTDANGATTTGKVAEYLEDDYHVMLTFLELHESYIMNEVAAEFAGAVTDIAAGKPFNLNSPGPMSGIENEFRQYLDKKEWEATTGQVIQAAKEGISHRFKSSKAGTLHARSIASGAVKAKGIVLKRRKRPGRPAFIDTGLYQASFTAWIH